MFKVVAVQQDLMRISNRVIIQVHIMCLVTRDSGRGLNLGSARISIHLWHRISADDHHCLAQDRYSNLYTYDGEALM